MKIQLFQKGLKEVARPKGTVVTLFDMKKFIICVHVA